MFHEWGILKTKSKAEATNLHHFFSWLQIRSHKYTLQGQIFRLATVSSNLHATTISVHITPFCMTQPYPYQHPHENPYVHHYQDRSLSKDLIRDVNQKLSLCHILPLPIYSTVKIIFNLNPWRIHVITIPNPNQALLQPRPLHDQIPYPNIFPP